MRFPIGELAEHLREFAASHPDARVDPGGRRLVTADGAASLTLPFLVPPLQPGRTAADCFISPPPPPGRHVVVLVRAGAFAIGYWNEHGALLAHKAHKRYVTRGSGKAQPTHLKTRGKSRYGSRLRLQNFERQLDDVGERLRDWWQTFGAPAHVFLALPVRLQHELFDREPAPPFGPDDDHVFRIAMHVHEPDHAELLRVHGRLATGAIELPDTD